MFRRLMFYAVTFGFLISISIALERRAYGYVDPGSGLLFFQGAGALLSGVLFHFRKRLKMLLRRDTTAQG